MTTIREKTDDKVRSLPQTAGEIGFGVEARCDVGGRALYFRTKHVERPFVVRGGKNHFQAYHVRTVRCTQPRIDDVRE